MTDPVTKVEAPDILSLDYSNIFYSTGIRLHVEVKVAVSSNRESSPREISDASARVLARVSTDGMLYPCKYDAITLRPQRGVHCMRAHHTMGGEGEERDRALHAMMA